jgi:predicted anti-sigma-YlaC factor YlaD
LAENFDRTLALVASSGEERWNHWHNGDSQFHFGLVLDADTLAEMDIDHSSVRVAHFEEHLGNPGRRDAYTTVHWALYIEHHSSADIGAGQGEEPVAGNLACHILEVDKRWVQLVAEAGKGLAQSMVLVASLEVLGLALMLRRHNTDEQQQ